MLRFSLPRGLARRRMVASYRAALTRAGRDIVFGGPHITLQSGPASVGRGIAVGDGCTIYDYCQLVTDDYTSRCGIEIGDNCHFNYGCYLCGTGGLTIGSDCLFGPGVKVIAANHQFDDPSRLIIDQGHVYREVVIGEGVWVGAGAIVLPGVYIGAGAVIAAGAVVTDNVGANWIVGGVPARPVRMRGEDREPDGSSDARREQLKQ